MDEDDLSTGEDEYGFGTTSDEWPTGTGFNSHYELGIENGKWTNEDGEEVQSDPDSDHDWPEIRDCDDDDSDEDDDEDDSDEEDLGDTGMYKTKHKQGDRDPKVIN